MAPSKLKAALAREKGVDFKQIKQKKQEKEAIKNKRKRSENNGGGTAVAAVLKKGKSKGKQEDDDDEKEDEDWEDEEQQQKQNSDENEDEDEDEVAADHVDWEALDDSDSSGSEVELEEKIERRKPKKPILKAKNAPKSKDKDEEEEEEDEDEDEDEEDIPMSDLEDLSAEDREDLVPHTRLTINNTAALLASLNRIAIATDGSVAFATHQCVAGGGPPTADGIEDVQDDLGRELAFYGQSLEAARRGRALLGAEGVPFSRPADYFAEMVKDDGHMEQVRAKLVEEASAKKASAEARKLRDLKKFGKQVQVAKLQERQKSKRDTLEKIKTLKRKRQESSNDVGTTEADLFDVGVESELKAHKQRSAGSFGGGGGGGKKFDNGGGREQRQPNAKRVKKNEKFGFGGKKRHAKSGDAVSTGDMSGFSARRMKYAGTGGGTGGSGGKFPKTARLGKSRRSAGAGRR